MRLSLCDSLFVCVVRVSVCLDLFYMNAMFVCSAFRGSSQQWERRRGRSKLFDHLGCCYKALDVSTLCLSQSCHMTGHKHVT